MMNEISSEQIIDALTKRFFASWKSRSFDDFPEGCHPQASIFVKTYEVPPRPLAFIKSLPAFVNIELDSVQEIRIFDDQIASVHITYNMTERNTNSFHVVGKHSSLLNLIKIDGIWTIVSMADYGVEV